MPTPTFKRITLTSKDVKSAMEFQQYPNPVRAAMTRNFHYRRISTPMDDICRGVGGSVVFAEHPDIPDARINPIILHVCKKLDMGNLVVFERAYVRDSVTAAE